MSVPNLTRRYLADLWELRDKRMDAYPLMSSPWPTVSACCAYAFAVTVVGPWIMARREKPFEIRGIMTVYNAFQV